MVFDKLSFLILLTVVMSLMAMAAAIPVVEVMDGI